MRCFHSAPPEREGEAWGWRLCLDQDEDGNRTGAACSDCEANSRRAFRGSIRVLWRGAEARWDFSQTVGDKLAMIGDLRSNDFIVRRTGTGFDTVYAIDPA
jgi:hypothetical protein